MVALLSSGAYLAACWSIDVNPLTRAGQVSGLAAIDLRFVVFALAMIAALAVVARRGAARLGAVTPLACAYLAGLASAIVAAGIHVTLARTEYGLGGAGGDVGILARWADGLHAGESLPGMYPPLQIHLLDWIARLTDLPPIYAMKWMQISGLFLLGPLAYASWRLVLPPLSALAIGVTASLPLIDAYRVYPQLTLVVFVPICIRFLRVLRYAEAQAHASLLRQGAILGAVYGVLFLLYSGWFQWSAPGLIVAGLLLFPWRTAPGKGALFGGAALVVFVLLTARYVIAVSGAPIADDYKYFDTTVDPAYIAMWKTSFPGPLASIQWPLPGELAEVGLFTVLLTIGLGAAVGLGRDRTVVIGAGSMMVGTWLFRFHYASQMDATGLVQLYPRTTAELLYLLLVLGGYAIHLAYTRRHAAAGDAAPSPNLTIGVLAGLSLLYMSTGSATTNRYQPKDDVNDVGFLAHRSHTTPPLRLGANIAPLAQVVPSTVLPGDPHAVAHVNDTQPATSYSSAIAQTPDQEEWLQFNFPYKVRLGMVKLLPAADGAPAEIAVEVWTGVAWLPRATTSLATATGEVVMTWKPNDYTDRMRLRATKLGAVSGGFALRLAEVQIRD